MARWKAIRERARVSRDRAAVLAGVSYPTAKLFEAGGESAIKDPDKRAALLRVYRSFDASGEAG